LLLLCMTKSLLRQKPRLLNRWLLPLKETMEGAGRALLKIVPLEAEVAVVGSWAEK
jgi:hypothetical protein